MSVNFVIIGKRVKEVRKQHNLTQAKLAEYANLSPQYLSQIETAKKQASLQSLISISQSLKISLDDLLIGNQVEKRSEYYSEIIDLMEDCSGFEKRVIFELVNTIKK
ncbi:helix-turn-helix domain-containing protein, partial [Anaerosporobacter sp.]|uniref:helix-turn-helix domain-containing protein n=1 Tax=Anaerosporobacter sp. TaxID=1872529 RepID=UPI00286FA09E